MLHKEKPDLSLARGFGSKVLVKRKAKSKLESKAKAGRWIGISKETKGGHLVYWQDTRRVTTERDVRFVDGTVFVGEDNGLASADDGDVVTTTVANRLGRHPRHPRLIQRLPSFQTILKQVPKRRRLRSRRRRPLRVTISTHWRTWTTMRASTSP